MHFHASNIPLPTRKNQTSCKSTNIIKGKDSMSYFRILKHGGIILVTLSRDLFKIYDPLVSVRGHFNPKFTSLVSVQGHFNSKFMTFSSQYKVTSIQNLWPSRLSTRSLQSKINDPFVSVQGQNEEQRPFLVSVQGHFNQKFTTLSS